MPLRWHSSTCTLFMDICIFCLGYNWWISIVRLDIGNFIVILEDTFLPSVHVYIAIRNYGMNEWIQTLRYACVCQQICISPTPGRSSKLIHTVVEFDTCAFQTSCQLSNAASGMSLELRFRHNFSGMKGMCWTTGSWRSCLSLEVVSSIPVGSTIIYRFLHGFICVSLWEHQN